MTRVHGVVSATKFALLPLPFVSCLSTTSLGAGMHLSLTDRARPRTVSTELAGGRAPVVEIDPVDFCFCPCRNFFGLFSGRFCCPTHVKALVECEGSFLQQFCPRGRVCEAKYDLVFQALVLHMFTHTAGYDELTECCYELIYVSSSR